MKALPSYNGNFGNYRSASRNILEDLYLEKHGCENLALCTLLFLLRTSHYMGYVARVSAVIRVASIIIGGWLTPRQRTTCCSCCSFYRPLAFFPQLKYAANLRAPCSHFHITVIYSRVRYSFFAESGYN